VLLVLPADAITGLGGFLDAVKESYTIYGGAASFLYGVTCVLFIFTLMNSGASWMMCGDRVLAVASADGGFFPYFGAFHAAWEPRCGPTCCRASSRRSSRSRRRCCCPAGRRTRSASC